MKLKYIIAHLILINLLISCSKESGPEVTFRDSNDGVTKVKTIRFSEKNVPSKRRLRGELLNMANLMSSPMSLIFNDSYLIVTDMDETSLIHVIDPKSKKYVQTLGKKGFGPKEIMTSMYSLSLRHNSGSSFWSYDVQQRRFSKFSINSNDSSMLPQSQFVFRAADFMSIKVSWTANESLLGLAVDGESRFTEYDTTGVEKVRYGDYDNLFDGRYSSGVLAQLYQGGLRSDPENKKFVHSSIYVDQLELFDINQKKLIEIIGPLNIDPIFKEGRVQGYPVLDIDVNETYHAYMDSFVGREKVYGLFSGKKWNGSPFGTESCNEVYVFNFDGEVIEKLELAESIKAFTIDEDKGFLYGITLTENPDIIKFKL